MPPKKNPSPVPTPVKIGLFKKSTATPAPVDESLIFSESMMVDLEEIVDVNVDGEVIAEVIVDEQVADDDDDDDDANDPDYIDPVPSTSRQEPVEKSTKRSLFDKTDSVLYLEPLPKGRTNTPIWHFFIVADCEEPNPSGVGVHLEKYGQCQVPLVPGSSRLCNAKIKQLGSTTSGLNSHLKSQHPNAYNQFIHAKASKKKATESAKRVRDDLLDNLEGTPPSKISRSNVAVSGVKPLMKTPFDRALKYGMREKIQQRFDLWVTELWVRIGLPWSILDHPAYKDFWRKVNDKYHLKHSSVFSRAKLPLLFDQVKQAVDKVIQREVKYTTGVAFTSDHWTSRNMDPYLGVTAHLITKDWTLAR